MIRDTESARTWARQLAQRLAAEHAEHKLPTVIAGVDRTVRRSFAADALDTIALLPGNHDRTSWADLHNGAWPLVADWLRADHVRALEALARARSTRRYAGGLDEIWPLAAEGRVDTLVVEEGYAVAARLDGDGRIQRADDTEAPDVIDDIVDELIEAVLLRDGRAVLVGDGALDAHDRVAAVLRY
jgi:hypothetical protein